MSIVNYFKHEILVNTCSDNKKALTNDVNILEYIQYANTFNNPRVAKESYGDIYYLCEHLKNQFQDLQSCRCLMLTG